MKHSRADRLRERTAPPSARTVVRADAGSRRLEFCAVRMHPWSCPQRRTVDRAGIVSRRNNQCMTGRSTALGCLSEVGISGRLIVHVPPHTLPWHVTLVMAHTCPFMSAKSIPGRRRAGLHGTSAWHPICGGSLAAQIQRLLEGGGGTRHQLGSSRPANYILAVMYSPQYNGHAGDRGYRVNPRVN